MQPPSSPAMARRERGSFELATCFPLIKNLKKGLAFHHWTFIVNSGNHVEGPLGGQGVNGGPVKGAYLTYDQQMGLQVTNIQRQLSMTTAHAPLQCFWSGSPRWPREWPAAGGCGSPWRSDRWSPPGRINSCCTVRKGRFWGRWMPIPASAELTSVDWPVLVPVLPRLVNTVSTV